MTAQRRSPSEARWWSNKYIEKQNKDDRQNEKFGGEQAYIEDVVTHDPVSDTIEYRNVRKRTEVIETRVAKDGNRQKKQARQKYKAQRQSKDSG